MKRTHLSLVLVLLIGLVATVGHAEDKMESKDKKTKPTKGMDISATLEAKERQVQEAFKNKNVDAFMSMVDPSAWMVDPSGINPVTTAPEFIKMADIKSYTVEGYKAYMIAKDTYIATYTWNGVGTMGGQPYPPGPWYCSTVWAKRGNDWKAVFHQESLAMEMPEAGGTSD